MSQDVQKPSSEVQPDNNQNQAGNAQTSVQTKGSKGIKISWQMIIGLIILVIVIVFAAINTQKVTLNLLFTELQAPMIVIILCSVALGVIITLLAGWRHRRKKAKK